MKEQEYFVITEGWFNSNGDHISGLNRAQAEAVGERYPLKSGWKTRIVGKVITLEQKIAYEKAKGLTYAVKKQQKKTKNLLAKKETLELELEIAKMQLQLKKLKKKSK